MAFVCRPSHIHFQILLSNVYSSLRVRIRVMLLMPLSTIFQLYRGGQYYWWRDRRKPPTCRKLLINFITYHTPHWRLHIVARWWITTIKTIFLNGWYRWISFISTLVKHCIWSGETHSVVIIICNLSVCFHWDIQAMLS